MVGSMAVARMAVALLMVGSIVRYRPSTILLAAFGMQEGGGLFVEGTATLTNNNVYANRAGDVCSPSALSSSASLYIEPFVCPTWLAGWRWPLRLRQRQGNAEQHQRVR